MIEFCQFAIPRQALNFSDDSESPNLQPPGQKISNIFYWADAVYMFSMPTSIAKQPWDLKLM